MIASFKDAYSLALEVRDLLKEIRDLLKRTEQLCNISGIGQSHNDDIERIQDGE